MSSKLSEPVTVTRQITHRTVLEVDFKNAAGGVPMLKWWNHDKSEALGETDFSVGAVVAADLVTASSLDCAGVVFQPHDWKIECLGESMCMMGSTQFPFLGGYGYSSYEQEKRLKKINVTIKSLEKDVDGVLKPYGEIHATVESSGPDGNKTMFFEVPPDLAYTVAFVGVKESIPGGGPHTPALSSKSTLKLSKNKVLLPGGFVDMTD